jgi:hypothetical protein
MNLAILGALAALSSAATIVPKAKWGQDMTIVYLSLAVTCEPSSRAMAISNSSFSFSCDVASSMDTAVLEFEFKEDIDALDPRTKCMPAKKGVLWARCSLAAASSCLNTILLFKK